VIHHLRHSLVAVLLLMGAPALAQEFDGKGREIKKADEPPDTQKITPAKPKTYVAPEYTKEAADKGIEGSIILKLTIDIDGKVTKAVVMEGLGHGLDEAAIKAAKQMDFEPARRANGNPFKAIIRYRFNLHIDVKEVVETPVESSVGVLKGRVLVRGFEEPLAGAEVTLELRDGTALTVVTDENGVFDFGEIEEGAYRVIIDAEGHGELVLNEVVEGGAEVNATYRISQQKQEGVFEVSVEEDKPPREVTKRTITKREIERIPGTNGDALRSIQSLPGVARPPGLLGLLIVRGSAPFDTLTYIDGVNVPLIYHFGGLSSVVPTELLSKIDFYPGNFSAKYGRAMGGIVDAGIRSPSDEYHGLVQVDLIDARLMLEGPVPNVDGWTFAAAGRRSWFDAWLGPVLDAAGAGVTQAPRYYDYQLIVERKHDAGKFRTSFYGADDRLEIIIGEPAPNEPALSGNIGFTTVFQRVQLGYDHRFDDDNAIETQFALRRDLVSAGLATLFFDLEVFGVDWRAEYTRRLAKNAQMNVGFDLMWGSANVNARLPAASRPGQAPNQPFSTRTVQNIEIVETFFRPAAYIEFELTPVERWRIVPGFRLDYAEDTNKFDASPRFNTRFDVVQGQKGDNWSPRTTLKGGVGIFHQPPQFQQSVEPLGTEGVGSNRAIHYGIGIEQEVTSQIDASAEFFYKQLDNLVVAEASDSGSFVEYVNTQTGNVVGGELLVKYKPDDHFFGWLAYTISRSVRQNSPDEDEFLLLFDQTHILTMLGSFRFGGGWEAGARFRVVSGNLTTPNVCKFGEEGCDPNRINALFHAPTGAYTPIRAATNNDERLPLYHALDIRIDKAWQFDVWKLSAYLDVQNVYNSQNVEGVAYSFDFTDRQFVTGIPILPSIGLRGEF
jgi:TonB family protein